MSGLIKAGGLFFAVMFSAGALMAVLDGVNKPRRPAPQAASAGPELLDETCRAVVNAFGLDSEWTDLKKERQWPHREGKTFKWRLEVRNVDEAVFSGFLVHAKCEGSSAFNADLYLRAPSSMSRTMGKLEKGSWYTFTGVLDERSGIVMPITADIVGVTQ